MNIDERFLASSNVWRRYGLLFKTLMNAYGFERALELHLDARTEVDEKAMNAFKEKRAKMNDETYRHFIEEVFNSSGYDASAAIKEDLVELKVARCPFYTGFTRAGIDHEATLSVCGSGCERRARNYPLYRGVIKYRESAEGNCVEAFRI